MSYLSEHEMQESLFAEIDWRANQDPRWGKILCIPNGQYRPGQRMEPGIRAGALDIFWPLPRDATYSHPDFHGLFMELKVNRNDLSPDQKEWVKFLEEQGYFVCVIRDDPAKAIEVLKWYLGETE